jgi:hypothetical protein
MCTSCLIHPIPLDYITMMISGEECKLQIFLLLSFLQPPSIPLPSLVQKGSSVFHSQIPSQLSGFENGGEILD